MKTIKVKVVSPLEVAKDGFYKWVGATNDCEFLGDLGEIGYTMGFCVEVIKADGTLAYSSVTFIDEVPTELHIAECYDDTNKIDYFGIDGMVDICLHDGNAISGRLVFRGYYEKHYDYYDEYFTHKSDEVVALFSKYVVV